MSESLEPLTEFELTNICLWGNRSPIFRKDPHIALRLSWELRDKRKALAAALAELARLKGDV